MAISLLRLAHFRNISAADIEPSVDGINIISGDNGSGKTSLLEAIYYLGMGRSFRSSQSSRLIQYDAPKFSIFSQLINELGRIIPVGMERDASGSTRIRLNDSDESSITALTYLMPIRIINSQSHQLFDAPLFRRKFLDWGLFYHQEKFLLCWRHFERALKQRNSALKMRRSRQEVDIWTEEFVKYGLELDVLRQEYVATLTPIMTSLAETLLGIGDLTLDYYPGWNQSADLASVLHDHFADEYRMGHTQYGPHRADFDVLLKGVSAKHFMSRGQQKLLICAMILAQGAVLDQQTNKGLIYLLDDLPAELDSHSQDKLMGLLLKQRTQIFVSAIENETIVSSINNITAKPIKVFHVEHGSINEAAVGELQ